MGDGQRRAAGLQFADRRVDLALGLHVEVGRGLVEDQDRRVLEQRPRDGEALALAAGDLGAHLADRRLVAVRQAVDPGLEIRAPRRLVDLGLGRVRLAHADVVADGGVEDVVALGHDRHEVPQLLERQFRDRPAADANVAPGCVPEAQQQVHDRRLAGAAGADQCHVLARRQVEADAAQDIGARLIAELHVVEARAGSSVPQRTLGAVLHRRLLVHQLEQAVGADDGDAIVVDHVVEADHGPEARDVMANTMGRSRSTSTAPDCDEVLADPQHRDRGRGHDEFGNASLEGVGPRELFLAPAEFLAHAPGLLPTALAGAERQRVAQALEAVGQKGVDLALRRGASRRRRSRR